MFGLASAALEWEPAPFMDSPPFGLDTTHTFGFTLKNRAYISTGNLRVPEYDYCGECAQREDFSDAFYSYDPTTGWTDLGMPAWGARGYAGGDVMYQGTPMEIAYFGFGQTRVKNEDGTYQKFPRWGFDSEGNYYLNPEATTYPRLQDFWSFDGTDFVQLASCPGIGRTHPSVVAVDGYVYYGMGWGELCTTDVPDACPPHSAMDDVRGKSGNLQDVWLYEVATDSWKEIAPLPRRAHHGFQFGIDGNAYFLFGHDGGVLYDDVYRHNLFVDGTDTWTLMAPIPSIGRVAGTQFNLGSFGFVLSGEAADQNRGADNEMDNWWNTDGGLGVKEHHRSMDTAEFWRYDPMSDEWAAYPAPPGRSRWAPTNFILGDYVYYLQGVVRQGHEDEGNFVQTWPTQGYRMKIMGDLCEGACGDDTTCVGGMCVVKCDAVDVCCGNTSPTVCTNPAISACVGVFDPFCTTSGFDAQCQMEARQACGLMC